MRADLGYAESSALERLLIQQVTLCWLNLNLTEYRFTNVMKQSITLTLGMYWEKRLTAAHAVLLELPRLWFNIAANGGQQVNVAKGSVLI
jgi:hypothetical protein